MDTKENAHARDMGAHKNDASSKDAPKIKSSINHKELQPINLRAALYYAKRGWPVLPLHYPTPKRCSCGKRDCSSVGKHPRSKRGSKDATTDIEQIKKWWRLYPKGNVGILMGKISSKVALDVDSGNGGDESLKKLERKYGKLPTTVESITGGGGRHIFFSYPKNGLLIKNKAGLGEQYPGLDIRGEGGYVVAPPSKHQSGEIYKWKKSHRIDDIKLAPIPKWLLKLITSSKKNTPSSKKLPEKVKEGARNTTLFKFGCSLQNSGVTAEAIKETLHSINKIQCDPPLSDAEVEEIVKSTLRYKHGKLHVKVGGKIKKDIAADISKYPIPCPDPYLQDFILIILDGKNEKKEDKTSDRERRKGAGVLLLDWLTKHGGFIQSEENELFYFYKIEKKLYNLDSPIWYYWLHALTGINPASREFSYFIEDCRTAASFSPRRKITKLAYWDDVKKVLYVSRFDGVVFRIDGESITEEVNGENILFYDDQLWSPYELVDGNIDDELTRQTSILPNWDGNEEMLGLVFRSFILTIFFSELCPSRPFLALVAEKGSGKTTALRIMLKNIFGPNAQVIGVPVKNEDFRVAASANRIMVIDDFNTYKKGMQDRLAGMATGMRDEVRKLYTTNDRLNINYNIWIAFAAVTPDTLKRDDLTDRLIILPLKRIDSLKDDKQKSFNPDRDFNQLATTNRNIWWTNVMRRLLKAVALIKDGKLEHSSPLRNADWETVARLFAMIENKMDIWNDFIYYLTAERSNFLLDGDPICDAIEKAMADNLLPYGEEMTAREVYNLLTKALYGDSKSFDGWFKSPQSFSKRFSSIKTDLAKRYGLRWKRGTDKLTLNRIVYWFEETEESALKAIKSKKNITIFPDITKIAK